MAGAELHERRDRPEVIAESAVVSREVAAGIVLAAAALFIVVSVLIPRYTPDDAYISYRYAVNLADGHGLTFNVGESPTEGFTNMLWVLLGAGASSVGNIEDIMPLVGIGAALGAILVVWGILRQQSMAARDMTLPLAVLVLSAPFITYSSAGLETPLFALLLGLMVLVFNLATKGVASAWGLLACSGLLLTLTRPEGLIAFPLFCVLALVAPRARIGIQQPLRPIVVSAAAYILALVAYEAWRVAYFDEWLPLSFLSKGGADGSIFSTWRTNLTSYFVHMNYDGAPFVFYHLAIGTPAVLITLLLWRNRALTMPVLAPVTLLMAYWLMYTSFADWMPGMRYHAPLVVLAVLPLGSLRKALGLNSATWPPVHALVTAVMVLTSLFALGQMRLGIETEVRRQERGLDDLGRWMKDYVPASSVLAMTDVGAAPYFSGLKTIDVNPASLIDAHIARNGLTPDYFFERDPDIVVFPSRAADKLEMFPEVEAVHDDPRFQRYRFLGTYRYSAFSPSGAERWMRVYVRDTMPISAEAMSRFPPGNFPAPP